MRAFTIVSETKIGYACQSYQHLPVAKREGERERERFRDRVRKMRGEEWRRIVPPLVIWRCAARASQRYGRAVGEDTAAEDNGAGQERSGG
jgi:hypothetical protein